MTRKERLRASTALGTKPRERTGDGQAINGQRIQAAPGPKCVPVEGVEDKPRSKWNWIEEQGEE